MLVAVCVCIFNTHTYTHTHTHNIYNISSAKGSLERYAVCEFLSRGDEGGGGVSAQPMRG